MSYDYIHEVLQDGSIEDPSRSILVRFHHKAFRPAGFDFAFPAHDILVEVLSETELGALEIVRSHHRLHGEGFAVENRPWCRGPGREVVIEERRTGLAAASPARRQADQPQPEASAG